MCAELETVTHVGKMKLWIKSFCLVLYHSVVSLAESEHFISTVYAYKYNLAYEYIKIEVPSPFPYPYPLSIINDHDVLCIIMAHYSHNISVVG